MIELRIYEQKDRLEVATILIKNGYDVGQHKRRRTETGKRTGGRKEWHN